MRTSTLPSMRMARIEARRSQGQELLRHAEWLPEMSRAIITAHLDRGVSVRELALIHTVSPRLMRRRVDQIKKMLGDPCFLLTAQYAGKLPGELQGLAKAYWMEGATLRELAAVRRKTMHRIRRQLNMARSLLLVAMASDRPVSHEQAQSALDGQRAE